MLSLHCTARLDYLLFRKLLAPSYLSRGRVPAYVAFACDVMSESVYLTWRLAIADPYNYSYNRAKLLRRGFSENNVKIQWTIHWF